MANIFQMIWVPALQSGVQVPTLPIGPDVKVGRAVNICHATDDVLPLPAAIRPITSPAAENGRVMKAAAGSVVLISCNIGQTSGWLLLLDATAVPTTTGALAAPPVDQQWVSSNGTSGYGKLEYISAPLSCVNGIVAAFSLDPNPANFLPPPAGSKAWFMGLVQ